jgi:hypothetical protein
MPGSIHPVSPPSRPSIETRKRPIEARKRRLPEQVQHEVERTMKFLDRNEARRYDEYDSDLGWIMDDLTRMRLHE